MRILATVRTFIMNYVVPGWGFWIVGKRKLGFVVALAMAGIVLVFSWSQLVLDPLAFIVLISLVMGTVFWTACYSALIEYRRTETNSPSRNWKTAFGFAIVYGVAFFLLTSNRSSILGYDVLRLPAASMAPTLVRGDQIVVDSWHYTDSDIEIGEVVVFEVPGSPGVMYIKRVVGIPGDNLIFESNKLSRNGTPIDEPYAYYADGPPRSSGTFPAIKVPDGEYFVMGDNRNNSHDSRHIGTIPKTNFVGRAAHIWYSKDSNNGIQWQRFPAKID